MVYTNKDDGFAIKKKSRRIMNKVTLEFTRKRISTPNKG